MKGIISFLCTVFLINKLCLAGFWSLNTWELPFGRIVKGLVVATVKCLCSTHLSHVSSTVLVVNDLA